MRKLFLGDRVELKVEMFGLKPGAMGVVYEEYDLGEGPAVSVIFENGEYDGFARWEQEEYLKNVGHSPSVAAYQFRNVMMLSRDFRAGVFTRAFEKVVSPEDDFEQARRDTPL